MVLADSELVGWLVCVGLVLGGLVLVGLVLLGLVLVGLVVCVILAFEGDRNQVNQVPGN